MRLAQFLCALCLLLAPLTVPAPALAAAPDTAFDLDAATIPSLQRMMGSGSLTSVRLTGRYLARIRSVDPKVHAVLSVDPTALAQAAASDLRWRLGRTRGPLDGIPVLLKDNIDTRGLETTAGSRALLARPPAQDASLVTRLRAAGAVVLGKTNLSEWANYRSTNSTSGWSGVGLQTANPYVLDRNPCGSSSGSGVAVAASLAQVAVGTETDGSIVCPAGANGVVGLKPSLGLVSRTGVVPISAEQDTAGPMARHAVDAAILLSALQGRDPADAATLSYPQGQPTDYARLLAPDALRGARIGVWRQAGIDPAVDATVQHSVDVLRARGATVVDVDLPYQDQIGAAENAALLSEFARDLPAYLAHRPAAPQTIAGLVAFDRRDPVELSRFGQELFEQALTAPPTTDPTYLRNRATATTLARQSIDDTLAAQHLDAIVSPTNGPAWVTTYGRGDVGYELGSSTPAAVAGYPDASVPAGYAGELPLGISFFAGRWSDARVLSLAAAFEHADPVRHAPQFLPTVG
ncbi:amidase [Amycolatopsis bartoniae]|uniref:Amidase n=1 Tax=Amycolatopsis bartoniae TaxID=941986 RepID=A0A8H9MDK7_9PSEU|nr:amidase [Amycolatopsis bartoniae]MBB2938498.1 amidase [Amycolatopsis bartoniae]TVT10356.1 amidase [Amycolatopsis bartoniae]GHF70576.1 amidase [Amycolatopsis bartoniae]